LKHALQLGLLLEDYLKR
jgi:hypothetical protein